MVRITRICKQKSLGLLLAASALSLPSMAHALVDDRLDNYVQAWVADISDDSMVAASKYLTLLNKEPDNAAFSEGLWKSSILVGDKKKALRAARVLELQGGVPEASLLLFGDAMERRDWKDAQAIINSLTGENNYSFLRPLFESWLRVGRGKAHGFPLQPKSQILQYYAMDQRSYLTMAARDMAKARISLGAFTNIDNEYARNLRIRAAPVLAANSETELANRLVKGLLPAAIASDYVSNPHQRRLKTISAADALSALYIRLASGLLEQDLPDQALALARTATWLAPHDDVAKLTLARVVSQRGKVAAANGILVGVDDKSPYWGRATISRIQNALKADQNDAALKMAKAAYARRQSPEVTILLGQSQEAVGDLDEARQTYERLVSDAQASRVAPQRRAIYHLYLATVQHKQDNWAQARKTLERGMALNPQNPYIINYLSYSLLERREEVAESLEMLQRAHRLAPQSMAITDSLGWGYFLTGDYSNAVRYLEKAARGSGADPTINEHLGDAYWLAGRFVDARYAWRTASLIAEGEDAKRLAKKTDLGLDGPQLDR